MKNLKKKIRHAPPLYKCIVVFSLALLLSFTFFSCGGLIDDVPDGYGKVRVSFGSSRNVTQDDKDAASVTVYFNGNKIEKKGDVYKGMVESGIKLTITAEAVSGGRVIGKGEETITVKSGTNDVSMKIYTYDNFVVTIDGKATGYTNFTDAWDAANLSNGTKKFLKMNMDASLPPNHSGLVAGSGDFTLDLNGHTLTGTGTANVINVTAGTFNLIGNGTVRQPANATNRVITVSGGTFNMHGGTITGGYYPGGGVSIGSNAFFNMYGGSITGNREEGSDGGGGVIVYGTFTMHGGSIANNIGDMGAGVCVDQSGDAGKFIMNGGVISGNQGSDAGGVYLNYGTFTMNGGTISGNTATSSGGGVYVSVDATFNQSGGSVTGNSPDNVYRAN